MSSRYLQILIAVALCIPVRTQGTGTNSRQPEIINLGWNREEIKPGKATILIERNSGFAIKEAMLIVKLVKSESEYKDNGYLVTTSLPKGIKGILAWRGINQIRPAEKIVSIELPPLSDQYKFEPQIMKFIAYPAEFVVERLSVDKQKVTIRSGPKQQVIFNSFPHFSGFWSPVWAGDLDGDGKLDLITQHEGFGEYIQERVLTLWLSSLAGENDILGFAGSRTIYVGGD